VTEQRYELEATPSGTFETHFEWPLDDEPPSHRPVFVDATVREDERRPIVPASLRAGNLSATAKRAAGRTGHRFGYHLVRLPWYALETSRWSVVGVGRIAGKQIRWWWVLEQHHLRQEAANNNDPKTWMQLHGEARAVRAWRGSVLLAELIALGAAGVALTLADRWWLWVATAAVAAPLLAHHGRPVDKPIVSPALVIPRFRILTADIVLRAYYAAKLADPDKAPISFGSVMSRDGAGSRVVVDLPYGKGFGDVVKARDALASGLDVATSQVFLSRDPSSNRRHILWVADVDPLAISAGRTPLLRCEPTDIWAPAPFGVDERGGRVPADLMWTSWLIGAIPRQGKTWSARLLALYAALDPYTRLHVYDGKGSPDWRKFGLVAHRTGFGLALTRDGDPLDLLLADLRALKAEVQERYHRLSHLPVDVCPEGKLTREIARDPRYGMPVVLLVLDEVQEYFDGNGDPDRASEVGALLIYLAKVAPAAGVIVLSSTQRPGGLPGKVGQLFVQFRDQHQVRFSLRTGSWQVSDLVLGAGAYSEGLDSSTLLPHYKGVGILRGASDRNPTVRTYLADGQDAERILLAARTLRERAGTLSGVAAGESVEVRRRDVLADVRGVFHAGEAFVSWQQLAARLGDRLPEAYAEVTPDAVSANVRAFGVPSVNGKHQGQVLKGAKAVDLDEAIRHRQIGGGS
jgi:S-DNA-T family DNA segregation ATPase FtsK/SpoIIIE